MGTGVGSISGGGPPVPEGGASGTGAATGVAAASAVTGS